MSGYIEQPWQGRAQWKRLIQPRSWLSTPDKANLLYCNHWGNSVILGAVEKNKRLKAGSKTKHEKTDTGIHEAWLTLGWLKVNDMDTDLSHLPFWAIVKSTASWMRALLWTKKKWRVLTVFFGIYMNRDLTRKPPMQLPCSSSVSVHLWIWSRGWEKKKDHSCTFHACLLRVHARPLESFMNTVKNPRATRKKSKTPTKSLICPVSLLIRQSTLISFLFPETTEFLY